MCGCNFLDRDANYISKMRCGIRSEKKLLCMDWNQTLFMRYVMRKVVLTQMRKLRSQRDDALTAGAWSDVTKLHYRQAFEWETNVEVGMLYLRKLKGMWPIFVPIPVWLRVIDTDMEHCVRRNLW